MLYITINGIYQYKAKLMINSSIHDIVLRMKKTCRNEYYKFYSKFWACTVKKTSSALSGILSPTLFCTCNSIPGNRQTLDVCCVIHDKGFPRPQLLFRLIMAWLELLKPWILFLFISQLTGIYVDIFIFITLCLYWLTE